MRAMDTQEDGERLSVRSGAGLSIIYRLSQEWKTNSLLDSARWALFIRFLAEMQGEFTPCVIVGSVPRLEIVYLQNCVAFELAVWPIDRFTANELTEARHGRYFSAMHGVYLHWVIDQMPEIPSDAEDFLTVARRYLPKEPSA